MAHYQNSQYPYRTSAPLPPLPQEQQPTGKPEEQYNRQNGVDHSNEAYAQGGINRHGSLASRQDAELFIGGAPSPPQQQYGSGAPSPYLPSPATYNPQDYASHTSPIAALPAGSPLSPGRAGTSYTSYEPSTTSYNPADYANTTPWSQQPAPTYAYTPAYPSGQPQQIQMPSMPSPPTNLSPVGRTYSYSSRPTIQTTSYSSHYGGAMPPPLPVIPSAGDMPSNDWGQVPPFTRYDTTNRRFNQPQSYGHSPLSPPQTNHSRQSSGQSASSGPPPPPPHRADSLNTRPLPLLPPNETVAQYAYESPDSARRSQTQQDLEEQILSLTGANGKYESEEDSDPEAIAGALAFQEAERQDREDAARRASGQGAMFTSLGRVPSVQSPGYTAGEEEDGPAVDLSMLGGGWDAHLSYGGNPNQLAVRDRHGSIPGRNNSQSHTVSSSGSMRRSGNASENEGAYGGLVDPSIRRLSFDEGDEAPLLQGGEYPEMFYHPGITNRPLPQLPREHLQHSLSSTNLQYSPETRLDYTPYSANSQAHLQSPAPGRHQSLVQYPATPSTATPLRAKTVGEERRQAQRTSFIENTVDGGAPGSGVTLDLPGVAKRYNPSKLTSRDFDRCKEPWAISELAGWLHKLVEDEQYLKRQPLIDGLVALFTHKVPNMHTTDAEALAERAIDEMRSTGTLMDLEEWVEFKDVPVSGVIFQLTGHGCYSPRVHSEMNKKLTKCYSYHCQRTEKKIDLSSDSADVTVEWNKYWGISSKELEIYDSKEVQRQNILHEVIQKEQSYIQDMHVLLDVFRAGILKQQPPIIPPKRIDAFVRDVFGKADAVLKANEEYLLPQLKYKQQQEGPFISGFSNILREWIRKAKTAYVEYASAYPRAYSKITIEAERSMMFAAFVNKARDDPRTKRLGIDTYIKAPITRIQQLVLLLASILHRSLQENEEKRNLQIAIAEIKAVAHECDARVGEGLKKVELLNLQSRLKLRPEMLKQVNLHLDHLGRELVFSGHLLRLGSGGLSGIAKFNWLDTNAILFDHYLVLAKNASVRTQDGVTQTLIYDVSRYPIPMDLLILESDDDAPVMRSALTGVTKVDRLQKTTTRESTPGQIAHSGTSISLSTMGSTQSAPQIVTNLDYSKEDKVLYPFKIKHLGKETYTLYAGSSQNREDWCNKITEAKTKHANSLFAQNAEPFKMKVIADTAFAYDMTPTGQRSVIIKGTPLDRAIREVEAMYVNHGRPGPVCRAKVNCATSFKEPSGKAMVAVGTDYGVYIAEENNPRGWTKVIPNIKATQISVIEEFSIFLVLADKALIAYHLDIICPANGVGSNNDASRRAPQKLSGNRDVGFFATGRMKERTLVFYKKKDVSSSTFKVITVLEPVLQRSTEKKSRFPPLRSGKTEFFREYDDFYIGAECTGMNVFHSSISVSTIKGFEILNLDRKQPMSIPVDIDAEHTAPIAQRISGQRPLGMFRLSDQEFLLCFETCAVYINKHGDINRSAILDFIGKARSAALYGPFVLLFDNDFVEIRNAMNGRLRQVIAGRDVKCLDDGQSGTGVGDKLSVKMSMQHPEIEKNQIIVELVLNEGLRE